MTFGNGNELKGNKMEHFNCQISPLDNGFLVELYIYGVGTRSAWTFDTLAEAKAKVVELFS